MLLEGLDQSELLSKINGEHFSINFASKQFEISQLDDTDSGHAGMHIVVM